MRQTNDLRLVDGEIMNFGKLYDPKEQGSIRVVQTPDGAEIKYVLGVR